MKNALVALQSDFGAADGRAGSLGGEILQTRPQTEIYNVMHFFPKGDVKSAAAALYSAFPFFPAGTVYVSLVELEGQTGVPTAALTRDHKFILAPDNGTFSIWLDTFGVEEMVRLDPAPVPPGRNIYLYYAALLAGGELPLSRAGTPFPPEESARFLLRPSRVGEGYVGCGLFSILRTFGNLNLNVRIDDFAKSGIAIGDRTAITVTRGDQVIFQEEVPYNLSFGYTRQGAPILFNGSSGYMGMGLNQDSFAGKYLPEAFDPGCELNDYWIEIRKVATA